MHTLTVGSLFSGVGALDLGLIRTGRFTVVYHVEKEPYCQRVLAKRWPDTVNYGDIRDCYGDGATEPRIHYLPYVDTLVGGFPCQNISTAGEQEGIEEGKESGLWREYARLIGEIRPRYVIVENVSALRSPNLNRKTGVRGKPGLGRVLGDLAALGYDAEWHCIPASALGAPHQRDRIFIMAYATGERLARAELLRQSNGLSKWTSNAGSKRAVAHSHSAGLQEWERLGEDDATQCTTSERGRALAGTRTGEEQNDTLEPGVCGNTHGLTPWLVGIGRRYRWPARPGEQQYPYEPSRVIQGRLPYRTERIKALGNAVVVAVGQFVGEMLLEKVDREETIWTDSA